MRSNLSAWYILLHPGRTRAAMEEMRQELSSAESAHSELREQNDALVVEVKALKEERSKLQAANTEISLKYKKLTEEYGALQTEIGEVHAMFEKVNEMKQAYDRKIERYKCKIADLKRDLKRLEEATQSDIAPIRIVTPPGKNKQPDPDPPKSLNREPADDWYLPLDL